MKYKKMRNIAAQHLAARGFKDMAISVLLGQYALGIRTGEMSELDVELEFFELPVIDRLHACGGYTITGRLVDLSEILSD